MSRKIFIIIFFFILFPKSVLAISLEQELNYVNKDISSNQNNTVATYRPEINIYSPIEGKNYGNVVEIIYEVTDKNDEYGQNNLGPVSIYYSTSIDARQRILLASNLPSKGVFKWDTKEISGGDSFNIIVDATDKDGETGESISGIFSIDHTAPIFNIKTDPTVSRGEDVKIIVDSTKDLENLPSVSVAQKGFNYFDVVVKGSGKHFEGTYKVVSGYNGTAEIKVSGVDISGNTSDLVVGGGQFSVGVEPPPKPIILYPLNKEIILQDEIVNVSGKVRSDTEVILLVNGTEKFSTNPNREGLFLFSNIKLKPDFNYGNNTLSIIAKDAARNISESADISVKFNIAPEIFIESPDSGQSLGTSTIIAVKAIDKNKDKLKYNFEISKDRGANWTVLVEAVTSSRYVWDTTTLSDGEYFLKATVDDGATKKSVIVENLIIKNFLPTFFFADGEKSFTNAREYAISGSVMSSVKTSPRSNIILAEYSINGGKDWSPVTFEDSGKNLFDRKFIFYLSNLEEKKYDLKLRAMDDRGFYGIGSKTLYVIFEPPTTPIISSIKNGDIISDEFDENANLAGIQVNIIGTSKPKTVVRISLSGDTFSGATDNNGKFLVSDVAIKKHGKNVVSFFAEDEAGNKSQSAELYLIYNNAPTIKFLNPGAGGGLNHKTSIDFNLVDPDGDVITKTVLSYRSPEEKNFRSLDINPVGGKFEFDVTNFKEGFGYELKLDSSDGISSVSKTIQFYVDNTSPEIKLNEVKEKNFKKDFKFEVGGIAIDGLSGIEFVEYSFDDSHWFKADIAKGYLSNKSEFKIKYPFTLDDGEYEIKFRSIDSAGNKSNFFTKKIFVDTMPPRIGNFEFSYNGTPLYPENNIFEVTTHSVIGLRVSLESDTKEAAIFLNKDKIILNQESMTGLWIGELILNEQGEYLMQLNAKDKFGNIIEGKRIGSIIVSDDGAVKLIDSKTGGSEPVEGADIHVLIFDENSQAFINWTEKSHGFSNPIKTEADGRYTLFLPAGKFLISIKKPGLVNLKTNEFVISNPKFINVNFIMKKREGVRGFIEDILGKFII